MPYRLLADSVLLLHAAVVLFVVGGWLLIVAGPRRRWRFIDALGFRLLHLATIAFVVIQSWLGAVCPLTLLESWLRRQAGSVAGYRDGFIAFWLQRLLFHEAPAWVFVLVYTVFGLLVAASWRWFPPRRGRSDPE